MTGEAVTGRRNGNTLNAHRDELYRLGRNGKREG